MHSNLRCKYRKYQNSYKILKPGSFAMGNEWNCTYYRALSNGIVKRLNSLSLAFIKDLTVLTLFQLCCGDHKVYTLLKYFGGNHVIRFCFSLLRLPKKLDIDIYLLLGDRNKRGGGKFFKARGKFIFGYPASSSTQAFIKELFEIPKTYLKGPLHHFDDGVVQ